MRCSCCAQNALRAQPLCARAAGKLIPVLFVNSANSEIMLLSPPHHIPLPSPQSIPNSFPVVAKSPQFVSIAIFLGRNCYPVFRVRLRV